MRRSAPPLTVLALLLAAPGADAQLVRGRVTDRVSGEPVAAAFVTLLDRDAAVRASARTDADGAFTMRPPPGRYTIRVARLGYLSAASRELGAGERDTLNFTIRLPPEPLGLAAVTVRARPRSTPDPSGFYRRQLTEAGSFVGPPEIARIRPTRVPDLLRGVPGLQFYPSEGGELLWISGRGRGCTPTVYLDGGLAVRGTSTNRGGPGHPKGAGLILDELVNPSLLGAVEIYQDGTDSPVRFRPVGELGGGDCAVIVLWTRAGLGEKE